MGKMLGGMQDGTGQVGCWPGCRMVWDAGLRQIGGMPGGMWDGTRRAVCWPGCWLGCRMAPGRWDVGWHGMQDNIG